MGLTRCLRGVVMGGTPWVIHQPKVAEPRASVRNTLDVLAFHVLAFIGGTVIMPTIAEALAIALEHQRAGRLRESETIYRQILAADPLSPRCVAPAGAHRMPGRQ